MCVECRRIVVLPFNHHFILYWKNVVQACKYLLFRLQMSTYKRILLYIASFYACDNMCLLLGILDSFDADPRNQSNHKYTKPSTHSIGSPLYVKLAYYGVNPANSSTLMFDGSIFKSHVPQLSAIGHFSFPLILKYRLHT